ncbi:MAG: hypothetical protein J2P54_02500, partial [Bradyrhizobiaceae bacterium]|nr:hypothetical protein [Bradyrhizobiaceae bacterium]
MTTRPRTQRPASKLALDPITVTIASDRFRSGRAENGAPETPREAAASNESPARAILGATLTFLVLVARWELLARGFNIPGWLLPAPSAIAIALAEWRDELVRHSLVTLYETLLGFALSIAISIPLAVAVVHSAILRNTIYPILLAFQS